MNIAIYYRVKRLSIGLSTDGKIGVIPSWIDQAIRICNSIELVIISIVANINTANESDLIVNYN
jgi:hypothetical protein